MQDMTRQGRRANRKSVRSRLVAVAVATGAVALAAPVPGASASTRFFPGTFGFPAAVADFTAIGGNQIGTAGCVGTNRPSFGGNAGSTSAQSCGTLLSFSGPQIGQIASVIGPTVIGSPASQVIVSAGPVTQIGG
jgi:hypothetical protein